MEHLRDLLRSGAAQPAQQQEMALLLDALPAAWALGFFFFLFIWKEAYMSIDANHISNPKHR